MATYAIGDIQGCYREFRHLLDEIFFDPSKDRLILLGDLVNRGNGSLSVIRFAMKYEKSVDIVLGNHDLSMLSVIEGLRPMRARDTFNDVLQALERDEIGNWLSNQPLLIHDRELNVLAVHAGIHPQWSLMEALQYAGEIEDLLKSEKRKDLLANMYGNKPRRWSESRSGWKRARIILNTLTRMRFISIKGHLDFTELGNKASNKKKLFRWFEFPGRVPIEPTIVFGHWSTLGVFQSPGLLAMDSGCCWGRCLSAARLDTDKFEITQVPHESQTTYTIV